MISVMEIFYSIQGEGSRIGRPSVFVRTGLCNFTCPGFKVEYTDPKSGKKKMGCDSFYSVDAGFKKDWVSYISYKELVRDILAQMPNYNEGSLTKPDIVLTGGEPLIYWNEDVYQRMIAYFITRGHKVTIETNAAMDIEFTREYQREIMFSQSVKLACSGEPEHKRFNVNTLTEIAENAPHSYLKFVTSKKTLKEDTEEIMNLLDEIPAYVDVWLMPLGDTNETLSKNELPVAEAAMKLGFNYSPRVHINLWDNKPGV